MQPRSRKGRDVCIALSLKMCYGRLWLLLKLTFHHQRMLTIIDGSSVMFHRLWFGVRGQVASSTA